MHVLSDQAIEQQMERLWPRLNEVNVLLERLDFDQLDEADRQQAEDISRNNFAYADFLMACRQVMESDDTDNVQALDRMAFNDCCLIIDHWCDHSTESLHWAIREQEDGYRPRQITYAFA